MKKIYLVLILITLNLALFAQAREDYEDSTAHKIYTIVISKNGKVKHVIKEGAMMSSKVDGKVIKGGWVFSAYPDVVALMSSKGELLGKVALDKELLLRITPPHQQTGMSVGVGIGPVSISGLGGGMKNFDLKKYQVAIRERPETKEEKMRREYYAQQEKERIEKEAAKKAKKDARKKSKKK